MTTTKSGAKKATKKQKNVTTDIAPESGEMPVSSKPASVPASVPPSSGETQTPESDVARETDATTVIEAAPDTARPGELPLEYDPTIKALSAMVFTLEAECAAISADQSLTFKSRRDRIRGKQASLRRAKEDIVAHRSEIVSIALQGELRTRLGTGSSGKRISFLGTRRATADGLPIVNLASMSGLPLTENDARRLLALLDELGIFERIRASERVADEDAKASA